MREDIFEIGSEGLSVTELSQKLALPTGEVVKTLFMQGIMVQVNQVCCLALAASLGLLWTHLQGHCCVMQHVTDGIILP